MKDSISPQDQEHISAYLDGQLSAGEQARLAARLKAEPRLRQELEEVRATAQALRGLPQVRVPRNFTLSPESAKHSWALPRLAFPTLRLATAFATAAFAFVLVLDFNASRQFSIAAPAGVQEARQTVQGPTAAAVAEDATGPTDNALGAAAVPESGAEDDATLALTAPEATPAPTKPGRTQVESPAFAPEGGEPGRTASGGAGPETPVASEKAADVLQATPGPASPTPTLAPAPAPAAEQADAASEVQLVQVPPSANPYRPVTLGLAGLAVLLGALALVARRFA